MGCILGRRPRVEPQASCLPGVGAGEARRQPGAARSSPAARVAWSLPAERAGGLRGRARAQAKLAGGQGQSSPARGGARPQRDRPRTAAPHGFPVLADGGAPSGVHGFWCTLQTHV
ncbi:hypothetical protein C2845_PM11G29990 [Panicum miliaceum]|uniref:Uncharacterized protein n=1 Tax=Panicum miliaceum TaxID=4540 RepID=A0A3L6RS73_PANMI|nr:hypothetical protein C2845_PM11G29990 [Panicum miliaceum]